jgi:hypothetical protein
VDIIALLGAIMGLGFISGINLYATILALGLALQFEFFTPPPYLQELEVLGHPYVLIPAGIAFVAEFFADKIPWVDSVWDSFHTFIRPAGAIVIVAASATDLPPAVEVGLIILCGGVALLSHSTKAGTRLVANHSPEPFSNTILSLAEDAIAIIGAWLLFSHPILLFCIVLVFVLFALWLLPKVFRLAARQIARVRQFFRNGFRRVRGEGEPVMGDQP